MSPERRIVIVGVVVTSLVMVFTMGAIRAYAIYRLSTDQAIIRSQFDTLLVDEKSRNDAFRQELDAIELTLYTASSNPTTAVTGNVVPPVVRRESPTEIGLLNNIKEVRDRLTVLEQWRMRVDRDLR